MDLLKQLVQLSKLTEAFQYGNSNSYLVRIVSTVDRHQVETTTVLTAEECKSLGISIG